MKILAAFILIIFIFFYFRMIIAQVGIGGFIFVILGTALLTWAVVRVVS